MLTIYISQAPTTIPTRLSGDLPRVACSEPDPYTKQQYFGSMMRTVYQLALLALPAALPGVAANKCHPRPSSSLSTISQGVSNPTGATSQQYSTTLSSTLSSSHVSTGLATSSSGTSGSNIVSESTGLSSASSTSFASSTESVPSPASSQGSVSTLSSITSSAMISSSISYTTTSSTAATASSSETTTSSTVGSSTVTSSATSATFDPAKYTTYEVTLPIVFSTIAVPTLDPTSTFSLTIAQTDPPPCAIDSAAVEQEALRVGDSSGNRFFARDGRIVVLQNSDFPSAQLPPGTQDPDGVHAKANQDFAEAIVYHLKKASNGMFDLTTTDASGAVVFVAWDTQNGGQVRTQSTSSGGANGSPITSLFTVSCEGELQIKLPNGSPLAWTVEADRRNTVMQQRRPAAGEDIQLVTTKKPSSDFGQGSTSPNPNSRRATRYRAMPDLSRRANIFTAGWYPRLPDTPPNMIAKTRPGAPEMVSDGCGSGAIGKYIPNLEFGGCCNYHDYCYANCATGLVEKCDSIFCGAGQFEWCNAAFYACMMNVCEKYPWYFSPILRAGCEWMGGFYTGVVSTSLGGNAFKSTTSRRCAGYCPDGRPYCGGSSCADPSDSNNCGECGHRCNADDKFACRNSKCTCVADILNDSNHCGACGNRCPYKTRCGGAGSCVCVDDQCGRLCVDKKSHPRNCGTCGTVCRSGFCWDGKCVDPSDFPTPTGPPVCLATNAIRNGGPGK